MAGLIRREDTGEARSCTWIENVVSQYVQLRPDGVDSQKGLCPSRDEGTPSLHIRPHIGRWHCSGCGEGGDVTSFVERIEHVSLVEAVEILTRKVGVELRYENDRRRKCGDSGAMRQRLIDAHQIAVDFYMIQLASPQDEAGRRMLDRRGFDAAAIGCFRVGYSPNSWDDVLKELRCRGFTEREIAASGLASQGNRGQHDCFRGCLIRPITSIVGDPIGLGARKLSGEDNGPKYLNMLETTIYKKSQVLCRLDMAKRTTSQQWRIVVVEGYTDVMTAQFAGVEAAVATCGTAFGSEHVRVVRRLIGGGTDPVAGVALGSGVAYGGEIIFIFDGDAADQKAALKAFQEGQAFAAQTFVCVAPEGMDPCEVYMNYGDEAVREIVAARHPLFEFAVRSVLMGLPLDSVEGRTTELCATVPMVASIRDRVLRGEYTRQLVGWLGMDEGVVRCVVLSSGRRPALGRWTEGGQRRPNGGAQDGQERLAPVLAPRATARDPVERVKREALGIYLQLPGPAGPTQMNKLPSQTSTVSARCRVHEAIRAVGGVVFYDKRVAELSAKGVPLGKAEEAAVGWYVERVIENADDAVGRAVAQLAVETLPESRLDRVERYVWGIAVSLIRQGVTRQIGDLCSRLQHTPPDDSQHSALFSWLIELEEQCRAYDAQIE